MGQDVWVIEHGDGAHLSLEETRSFFGAVGIGIGSNFSPYDLDGYLSIDARIPGQVDLTHTAAAYEAYQSVMTQLLSFQWHRSLLPCSEYQNILMVPGLHLPHPCIAERHYGCPGNFLVVGSHADQTSTVGTVSYSIDLLTIYVQSDGTPVGYYGNLI